MSVRNLVSLSTRASARLGTPNFSAGTAKGKRTAIPDDLADTRSTEEGVQRGDRWVEALGRQVDGAFDGAALRSGQNDLCKRLGIPRHGQSIPHDGHTS
jgi:hypothetical protein